MNITEKLLVRSLIKKGYSPVFIEGNDFTDDIVTINSRYHIQIWDEGYSLVEVKNNVYKFSAPVKNPNLILRKF